MISDPTSSNSTQNWDLLQGDIFFQRGKSNPDYSILNRSFIQDSSISLEAKGYYGSYIAESIHWDEIPVKYQHEMANWVRVNGGAL